jgi:hypothetical protein
MEENWYLTSHFTLILGVVVFSREVACDNQGKTVFKEKVKCQQQQL